MEDNAIEIIGERVAEQRKKKNMKQSELAKKVYVSSQVISNIERGVTKNVNDSIVNLLSYALNITIDYLTGESNDPSRNSNGLIVPMYILPEWDYDLEIKELIKAHSGTRIIENLMRNIIYYLTYVDDNDIGVNILKKTIEVLHNENSDKSLLLKVISAFADEN